MFGWFRRKPPENKLLARLASASAKRRARQNRTCEDDMKDLLNHALELAAFFLEGGQLPTFPPVPGGFPPFGAGMNPSGEMLDFNCVPVPGSPGALDVFCLADQLAMFSHVKEQKSWSNGPHSEPPPIEAVGQGVQQYAGAGAIHAAALVDRVNNQAAQQGDPVPAIRVQIEHVEVASVTWYLSYRIRDQKLIRGELSKVTGQSFVFAHLGPARKANDGSQPAKQLPKIVADETSRGQLFGIERHGDIAVVIPSDQVDTIQENLFQQEAQKALAPLDADPPTGLVVDLTQVGYCGSVFMSFLIRCQMLANKHGSKMVLAGVSEPVRELFQLLGPQAAPWLLYDTRAEALAALGHT